VKKERDYEMKKILCFSVAFALVLGVYCGVSQGEALSIDKSITIVHGRGASSQEVTAAGEIRRYLYLRTGKLFSVAQSDGKLPDKGGLVVVGTKDNKLIKKLTAKDSKLKSESFL